VKSLWVRLPDLADELERCQPLQRFEAFGEIVSSQERLNTFFKFLGGRVEVAMDGRFFERAVHTPYLSIRPGMVGFGQSMLDSVSMTDAVEEVCERMGLVR